ncbi:MAG: KEOPS complex subunit Pcc1 [Candidatus Bathyarchaeia archaeon]
MEADAEITLVYDSSEEALAISNSVSPDNLMCPKELTVETRSIGENVVSVISYRGDNMATLLSTIDDLLSCVSAAEKVIGAAREKR